MPNTNPLLALDDLFEREGEIWITSRTIAERFDKRHNHVLEAIRELLPDCPPEFHLSNFRQVSYTDDGGRTYPMFEMTEAGFSVVTFGFTGRAAIQWKVRYVEAFRMMAHALRTKATRVPINDPEQKTLAILDELRNGQNRIEGKVDNLNDWRRRLEETGRKNLRSAVKSLHISMCHKLNGTCPCCRINHVTNPDGTQSPFAQFDHFYASHDADSDHTWLICTPCHQDFTCGRVKRHEREAEFRAYQNQCVRLQMQSLPKQMSLML